VSKPVEVLDYALHGARIVVIDHAQPLILRLAERGQSNRDTPIEQSSWQQRAKGNSTDDNPVDPALDQSPAGFVFGLRQAFRVNGEHRIAKRFGRPFDAHYQLGIKWVG
jgi:hypothetical protein